MAFEKSAKAILDFQLSLQDLQSQTERTRHLDSVPKSPGKAPVLFKFSLLLESIGYFDL